METIKTIDLWTEQQPNQLECFMGAFIDGFENDTIPFDSYKVVRNCNCFITCNRDDLNISNKHNAIVFYKNNNPIRLIVINKETNISHCINESLNQQFNNYNLRDVYALYKIKSEEVDLQEKPIFNSSDSTKECDIGSCDRPSLLLCMLKGSYTQNDTDYGKNNNDINFSFVSNFILEYNLLTDSECFKIEHHCAFINKTNTRIIPLQDNSLLDIEKIKEEYGVNSNVKK